MARITMLKPRVATVDTSIARPAPKVADTHYLSIEHREWSRQVIARANGICQRPGCDRRGVRLFADHVIELKDMALTDLRRFDVNNGRALCGSCHTTKTNAARADRMKR